MNEKTEKKQRCAGIITRIITKTWGLGINFSKSKKKKVNISNSSKLRSECFDFSIERFSGSIGRSIIEVVQNCSVVIHDFS